MPVTSAQGIIGTQNYPDSVILLNYDDDDYSQGYGQIKQAFRSLTKNDILEPYISEHDFRSNNNDDNIGYNIHLFEKTYQNSFESAQPVILEFKFSENIPPGIYCYSLLLTNRLVNISSDGQRMFDLV